MAEPDLQVELTKLENIYRSPEKFCPIGPTGDVVQNFSGKLYKGAPLQADYQLFLAAPVASIFESVADHEHFCQLIPNLQHVYVHDTAQGTIRSCDFGNDMILEERIVLWQPPNAYAYTATMPNPFGIWNHYALVTCQPHQNGTHLRWQHYFEHDDLAAILTLLNTMFSAMFTNLIAEFGEHMG